MARFDGVAPSGADLEEWTRRFVLLSDPTRLRLLSHMHLHPASPVADLAAAAGITRTAASQALRVLRDQGWVAGRREGRHVLYSLVDHDAHAVLHLMGQHHHAADAPGHGHGDRDPASHGPDRQAH